MSASQHNDGRTLSYGLLGSVTAIPAGHSLEVVMVVSRGVNEAMLAWGDALLARHGAKRREAAWESDPTLRHLGYCTQNGAYYYHNKPAQFASYEDVITAVAAEANRTRLPYKWWLADSWWSTRSASGRSARRRAPPP